MASGTSRDKQGQHRIQARILRLGLGLMGDVKPVREGISELRIDSGPGYRVYFTKHGQVIVFLLAGGDKSTQEKDIRTAVELAKNL
jgi:putative addiction module killer protein